ncbi:hypothetical protein BFJ63_vAg18078 [Fusarium oxysporum f. sp. narcissi]|uniref:Tc1-like transposase DDE domain-containing protein n=1 Tax=Fusarium oxysporum f. sp. narcissi TaxID=451672 RepID=A0A4Q2V405_FUSOX|nr:hypothetical protein BFJ63_vAg18078 [Fusarium oxysporum f. sp. narcissi]
MAPNLAACQHALIHDMILAGYKNAVVARTANCRASSVRRIRANMRCYGSTKAPSNGVGRRRFLTPPMLTALLDRLAVKPNMYRDEMVEFLEKEFETTIPTSNIGRSFEILPAYTQEGILHYDIFPGSTDSAKFEEYIEQLLHHCGKWPEPNSVLVMDNASFHRSPVIEQMCEDAGVKLLYLSPYSSDFNPVEEFFAELKAFIKCH